VQYNCHTARYKSTLGDIKMRNHEKQASVTGYVVSPSLFKLHA